MRLTNINSLSTLPAMSSSQSQQLPEADPALARLSYRHDCLLRAMISIPSSPNPPNLTLATRISSVGILDRLPPEIVSLILGMLDVQSAARFSRVSFQGRALVLSQYAYRDLAMFVPRVLSALGRLGLAHLHSIDQLHGALQSERCATCIEYGAFLFLPTCERCCWECLRYHPSLRLISLKEAKRYFGLSERHLRRLPICRIIPGTYGLAATPAPDHGTLVAAKAAMDLGLKVHEGSTGKLAQIMARRCKSAKLLVTGRYLQGAGGSAVTAAHQGRDALMMPSQGNIPNDDYFGMASIPFPSLSKSSRTIESGLWCRGCEFTFSRYATERVPRNVVSAMVPSDCDPLRVLLGLERRARSRESFLDHIGHCYGARQLAPDLLAGIVE